jgi:hypothetical protein
MVQSAHQPGDTIAAVCRGRAAAEHVDKHRCRTLPRPFQRGIPDRRVTVRLHLPDARSARGGSQDVADLAGLGDGVQVCGRCGVTGGSRGQSRGFGGCGPGGSMSVEGSDALQFRPVGTVDERPGRVDRCTGTRIIGNSLLKDRPDVLCVPNHVTRHDAQLSGTAGACEKTSRLPGVSLSWTRGQRRSGSVNHKTPQIEEIAS